MALLVENKFSGLGIFAIISLLIFIPVLLSVSARGVTVSFYGGLILLFVGLLFFSGKKKFKRIAAVVPLVLILITGILIFSFPVIQDFIISNLMEMKARILVWEIAWKGFLEKPVLGWGLENFNIVFDKYFNPKLFLKEYGGEVWFDKTHNIVLDTLINSGIVGLISYLSVFCVSIFLLLKKCLGNGERIGVNLTIISLLIAYFVQNLLVFDMISSYVVLFLTLSFVNFLIQKDDFENNNYFVVPRFLKKLCYVLIFISTGACFYFGNIQPANSAINTAGMVTANNAEEAAEFYEKSLKSFKYNNEINKQFSSILNRETLNLKEDKEVLQKALNLAEKEVLKNIQDNDIGFRSRLALARIYVSNYRITLNSYYLDLAEDVLKEAMKLSPENQQVYWLLSDVEYKQGNFDSSVSLLKKAIDLEPAYNNSHWYLISLYVMEERYEEALSVIKEGEKTGFNWRENLQGFESVISIHESLKDYKTVSSLCRELLVFYPDNANLWLKLAISLFDSGDKEGAKEAAQKAIEINPTLNEQASDILDILLQ